ncbi:hypothetical protein ACFE04_007194 [Oxalis oulophora]
MFYSQFILAKKGPLGTIWIAAHLERKLRKNQVADTDIGVSVDSILFPDMPIALRLSSHLLLGVVRIYSRKVGYLFDDCSDALLKVKQAFRSAAVDLPPEESTAPYHSITLPETFDLDDFELPDNEMFQGNYVDRHIGAREQITLQDTMDGVVFSTSQFGLDERFGDGDTSHINLDIDEELLLGKNDIFKDDEVSGANLEESLQPMSPCEENENEEEMTDYTSQPVLVHSNENQPGGLPTIPELDEYAQAPSTPGLVQEPNLPTIQKTLANDDHLEVEDPSLTQIGTNDSTKDACNEPGYLNADIDGVSSLHNHSNHDALQCMAPEENGYHSKDGEIQNEQFLEDSQPDLVKTFPSVSETSETLIEESTEQNGIPTSMPVGDQTVGNCGDSIVGLEKVVTSPDCSHATSDFEKADLVNKTGALNAGANVDFNMKSQPAIPEEANFEQMHVLQPCSHPDASSIKVVLDAGENADFNMKSQPAIPDKANFEQMHVLQPCSHPDVSSIGGEEHPATGNEIEEDTRKLDEQADITIPTNNHLESTDSVAASDLPAPERLLSVPEDLHGKAGGLALTPEKEAALEGGDAFTIASELVSGRKRSFTESTITVESINSVETFGGTRFKRTAESIPDDDDLLSSILGGKRTFLKIKPTPPVREVTSLKRPRSAQVQRPSAMKRKILMDDNMVLHGDTIRQQLMNTEDIRRLRKKAPCTQPEILMIQRQFLEDEIFSEPIFTGMSKELIWLHNEKYDLSEITIFQDDENQTSIEIAMDQEDSAIPNASEPIVEHDTEANHPEGSVILSATECTEQSVEHDTEAHPPEGSLQIKNQLGNEFLDPSSFDTDGHLNSITDLAEIRNTQHENTGEVTEMEIETDNLHKTDDQNIDPQPVDEEIVDVDTGDVKLSNEQKDSGMVMVENELEEEASKNFAVESGDGEAEIKTDGQIHNSSIIDSSEQLEDQNIGDQPVGLESELEDANKSFAVESGDGEAEIKTDGQTHDSAIIDNSELVEDRIENNNMGEIINEDRLVASNVNLDSMDPTLNFACSEEPRIVSEELSGAKHDLLNDDENSPAQKADVQRELNTEIDGFDPSMEERGGFENIEDGIDTEFLNVDDDDVVEEDDGGMDGVDETRLLENTGWSSRTRAVAKYLQIIFEKEAVQSRKALPMDNLLSGKTRKEASRMFFETLVLKTKDYIQVEQLTPFDNIKIKAKGKLMKSDF